MERIGIIGMSWQNGGPEAIARFTLPVEGRPQRLPQLAREIGAAELVYLATCNRVELVVATQPGESVAALRPRVFESARIGETEITGQVRLAFRQADELGLVGPRLATTFDAALKVASNVHTLTRIGQGRVSLAEIALEHVRQRLERTPGPVALFGVSPMTERCAHTLAEEGVEPIVVNRSLERARRLATEVGGEAWSLEEYRGRPRGAEVLLLATAAPDPVLGRGDLERIAAQSPSGEGPLVVDLAVPPDVRPEDADAVGLRRVGMEQIIAEAEANRGQRREELAEARILVDESLAELSKELAERSISPLLAALQRRYQRTAVEGAERLFRKEMRSLNDEEQEAVRRWASTLARRFAHIPTLGLRGLAVGAGPEAVNAFLDGLDETLARELREAAQNDDAVLPAAEVGT